MMTCIYIYIYVYIDVAMLRDDRSVMAGDIDRSISYTTSELGNSLISISKYIEDGCDEVEVHTSSHHSSYYY